VSTNSIFLEAASFAARAHRHQLRKDNQTPYASHTFRVCLVVRHVFGFDDERMLAAALLHDTIEDTATDRDDIIEQFGPDVARWVAALTKDMRLPEEEREAAYATTLQEAEWQVKACKLGDMYDNLVDSRHLSADGRKKTAKRIRRYLDALRANLPADVAEAARLVEEKLKELEVQ
jgi:guanosine-3',5'-bis(diphosphate) 3'-pyrophosphohydrolase